MSMSQEEIEALMNESALYTPEAEESSATVEEESNDEISQDELAALVADIQPDVMPHDEIPAVEEESVEETPISINTTEQDEIAALVAGIGGDQVDDSNQMMTNDSIDDLLAGIDGITDNDPIEEVKAPVVSEPEPVIHRDVTDAINRQIDKGVYPLPVEKEHKVVNQLHEVAEDSEEKASKIFDVLSFVLDENSEIEKTTKEISSFFDKQEELLTALVKKFPNIKVFEENLTALSNVRVSVSNINGKLNDENNQIFVAMDLMQFHDINRQKIERVMSVIKKLSTYLNGLFEDDTDKPEVQIARHISGDSNDTVTDEDIESLIASFNG